MKSFSCRWCKTEIKFSKKPFEDKSILYAHYKACEPFLNRMLAVEANLEAGGGVVHSVEDLKKEK